MTCQDLAELIQQARAYRDDCHTASIDWQLELAQANAALALAQAANPPNPSSIAQWQTAVAVLTPIVTLMNAALAMANISLSNLEQVYTLKGCP